MIKVVTSVFAILLVLVALGCSNAPTSSTTSKSDDRGSVDTPPQTNSKKQPPDGSKADNSLETKSDLLTPSMLEGSWKVETIEFRGESRMPQSGMPETVQITDGVFNAFTGEKPIPTFSEMRMEINDSINPVELELVRNMNQRIESLPCIVELAGQQLRIAMPMVPANKSPDDSLPRPKSFDTTTGPFMVLSATRMQ